MLFDLFDNLHALQNVQTNKIETIFDCHLFVKLFIIFVDICIGSSENHDDIFPCTWVSVNMSGTVMIKEGAIYMNELRENLYINKSLSIKGSFIFSINE
jgi:hypothetical protein